MLFLDLNKTVVWFHIGLFWHRSWDSKFLYKYVVKRTRVEEGTLYLILSKRTLKSFFVNVPVRICHVTLDKWSIEIWYCTCTCKRDIILQFLITELRWCKVMDLSLLLPVESWNLWRLFLEVNNGITLMFLLNQLILDFLYKILTF